MAEEKKSRAKAPAKKPATRKKITKAAESKVHEKHEKHEKPAAPPQVVEAPKPVPAEEKPVVHHVVHVHKPKKEKKSVRKFFYGTGRRKRATAKVYLYPGNGNFLVNQKTLDKYMFGRQVLLKTALNPFALTETMGKYDVDAQVLGGGIPAQADALRMGIARALALANPELRPTLRTSDMLRRDPREKESKKYGRKRARRGFQYSKR